MSSDGLEPRIVIDGFSYDLTNFKHPGGSVIKTHYEMDGSDVFWALHFRSEKARKYLKALPRRPVTAKDPDDSKSAIVRDFRALREELVRDGYFKPIWSMQLYRFAESVALQCFSLWVVLNYSWVLGGLLYGLVVGRNGLLMHDMGHRAFAGNMYWDKLFHQIYFGFTITGSGSFWNNQHNKHHAATQELQHDTDLATLPIVAFHREIAKYGNPGYLRWQWLVFLPAQFLLFFYWKFTHLRHSIRVGNWLEVAAIVMHHVVTIAVCWPAGLAAWFVYQSVGYAWGGFYLATVFSMNHTHRPVVPAHTHREWVYRACEYTTNVEPTPWAVWLTGYLCYQMEHHMFPNMPHVQLPYVAPKVKALLEKHGVVYDVRPMGDALRQVFVNLYEVGRSAYLGELKA